MNLTRYIELAVLVGLVMVSGVAAHQRNLIWKDGLSLCSDVVKKSHNKARPHDYMGIAKYKSGLINDAIKHYKLAINIAPEYPYPNVNLGICYFDKGDVDSAITQFRRAIQLSPSNAEAHYNLGIAYGGKGLYQEASREIKIAKALSSNGKWNLIQREMKGETPSIPGHP